MAGARLHQRREELEEMVAARIDTAGYWHGDFGIAVATALLMQVYDTDIANIGDDEFWDTVGIFNHQGPDLW